MDYRLAGLENFGEFAPYEVSGKYEIPVIYPETMPDIKQWIGFNYAKSEQCSAEIGVHFFLDDYQFQSIWTYPKRYASKFASFGAVMSPDFSTYVDMPKALQIYNHYRKHWCAQYWQSMGVKVIPTISWSDDESFEWCFDGEPRGGVVAISTVGCERRKDDYERFRAGYNAMLAVLYPSHVIVYGKKFDYMDESYITAIEPFSKQMKERAKNGR